MDAEKLSEVFRRISRIIDENKEYLVELDQKNGDGDLGISMSDGFHAVCIEMEELDRVKELDLGKRLGRAGRAFNEAAPSSLGTILSFGFMGMAKCLKGTTDASSVQIVEALRAGVDKIMERAGSRPGQRTILDALCPAVEMLEQGIREPLQKNLEPELSASGEMSGEEAFSILLKAAAQKASEGAEATRKMIPVHGRAAYYGEKSLGHLDGGAVVGKLIFLACSETGR